MFTTNCSCQMWSLITVLNSLISVHANSPRKSCHGNKDLFRDIMSRSKVCLITKICHYYLSVHHRSACAHVKLAVECCSSHLKSLRKYLYSVTSHIQPCVNLYHNPVVQCHYLLSSSLSLSTFQATPISCQIVYCTKLPTASFTMISHQNLHTSQGLFFYSPMKSSLARPKYVLSKPGKILH